MLEGSARAPRVVDRRAIELSDRRVPASRQPYHAVLRARSVAAAQVERRLRRLVERVTRRSFTTLLHEYRRRGRKLRGVALVVGSTIDPATIGNDHIRAHALEGQLFRTALERAARARKLRCEVLVERSLYETAAGRLRRTAGELKRVVAELGSEVVGPWRSDEKAATLGAWLVLQRVH